MKNQFIHNRLITTLETLSPNERGDYEVRYRVYNSSEIKTQVFKYWAEAEAFIKGFPDTIKHEITANSSNYGRRFTGEIAAKVCSKSCSPGDYKEGGKCDENGCYEKPTTEPNEAAVDFKKITSSLCDVLIEKNKRYGNSALKPIAVFTGKSLVGQRADDKLSRIQNSKELRKNDVADLIGYLVLICKENAWTDFADQID